MGEKIVLFQTPDGIRGIHSSTLSRIILWFGYDYPSVDAMMEEYQALSDGEKALSIEWFESLAFKKDCDLFIHAVDFDWLTRVAMLLKEVTSMLESTTAFPTSYKKLRAVCQEDLEDLKLRLEAVKQGVSHELSLEGLAGEVLRQELM